MVLYFIDIGAFLSAMLYELPASWTCQGQDDLAESFKTSGKIYGMTARSLQKKTTPFIASL